MGSPGCIKTFSDHYLRGDTFKAQKDCYSKACFRFMNLTSVLDGFHVYSIKTIEDGKSTGHLQKLFHVLLRKMHDF